MTGGSVNGTIYGETYLAPATVPMPNQVTITYVVDGLEAETTLMVINPKPALASALPDAITAVDTPLVLTGSGFVAGSSILINNAAIPTVYLDGGHLSGNLNLTSAANSTVQVAVSNPDPGASVSNVLALRATFAPTTLLPSAVSVRAGGTAAFQVVRGGVQVTGGHWSVASGAGTGTIDASGLYQAPMVVPTPNQVTVVCDIDGSTAAGTITLENPAPFLASLSPSDLRTVSSTVLLAGSGFVPGSNVLVNGLPVTAAFIDSGHLSATVRLPDSAQTALSVAVRNPDPGGLTSNAIQLEVALAPVTLTASPESVRVGAVSILTAARDGAAVDGGVWSVLGGAGNGSIDASGTYHAPSVVPPSNQITVGYTSGNATSNIILTLTNPIPALTSISPGSTNALSTPFVLTGSGFLPGSRILVNNSNIASTFIDANHLSGTLVLPNETSTTVQVYVNNPDPGGASSNTLSLGATFDPVTATVSPSLVRAGGTAIAAATRNGAAAEGGSWSVIGGPVNGTIDAAGNYHAPPLVPSSNRIMVSYLLNGSSSTASLELLNPVPVLGQITPDQVGTLTTPLSVTGFSFLPTSLVRIDNVAIATTYIDSSHLTGTLTLSSAASNTLQVSVSNPDPGSATSSSLPIAVKFSPVLLSARDTSVSAGQTTVVTASRDGIAVNTGVWSVLGGDGNGVIDSGGTYSAPMVLPAARNITVVYAIDGSQASIVLALTSPVLTLISVTPNTVTELSTPIMLTGSGFGENSAIMVEGLPIPTTYLDATHLTGVLALAQPLSAVLQIMVNNPGPLVSNALQVNAIFQPIRSFNTPTYLMEQSDDFAGPFPSWANIKTEYGAVGDGQADDTGAIQAAITAIHIPYTVAVAWFPAGTYKISATLVAIAKQTFSLIGEDPATTIIKWIGPQGGTMLRTDGSTGFRISRLTFDGNGTAGLAEDITTDTPGGYYSTFNNLSDQYIHDIDRGIRLGVDAETTVERVFFDNIPTVCLETTTFNTLNIFVNDSLFLRCGTGVSDAFENGAGNFFVSNSYFVKSNTADISIGNTGTFSIRHSVSKGSFHFLLAYELYGNSGVVTAQNNLILDPTSSPFVLGSLGPYLFIDNSVRMQDPSVPLITSSYTTDITKYVFSMGNTYTPNAGAQTNGSPTFQGTIRSFDDAIVPIDSIKDVAIPTNVYVPPNLHAPIFEVYEKTGAAIQAAIGLAVASGVPRAVVHLGIGGYHLSQPLTFPKGSDIQLIGDDSFATYLGWIDTAPNGPAIAVPTSNVSLKNLQVKGGGQTGSDGIFLTLDDQPSTQVIVDEAGMESDNAYAVRFDGMEHSTQELFSAYTLGATTGIEAKGGLFRAAHEGTLGVSNGYTGSLQSGGVGTSLDVSAYGHLMIQDNFHDFGATSAQNFRLSGGGTLTEQSGAVFMNSDTPFKISNFDGKVSLIGLAFSGGFSVASNGVHTDLLNLGLLGTDPNYLPASSPNVHVDNLLDSYWQAHIPDQVIPDAGWLREMLAQTRTEYPIARKPLRNGASRIRIERVQVNSASTGIHIVPDGMKTGLYYSISAGSSQLGNVGGNCVSTSAALTENQWLLMAAGDGDFEMISRSSGAALGLAALPDATVVLEPLTNAYDQRWMIQNLGDGTFSFKNRQTGQLLSGPPDGGCASVLPGGSTDWTVTAY